MYYIFYFISKIDIFITFNAICLQFLSNNKLQNLNYEVKIEKNSLKYAADLHT